MNAKPILHRVEISLFSVRLARLAERRLQPRAARFGFEAGYRVQKASNA